MYYGTIIQMLCTTVSVPERIKIPTWAGWRYRVVFKETYVTQLLLCRQRLSSTAIGLTIISLFESLIWRALAIYGDSAIMFCLFSRCSLLVWELPNSQNHLKMMELILVLQVGNGSRTDPVGRSPVLSTWELW